MQIRGLGLILGTEFVDNKSPNDPFPAEWGLYFIPFVLYFLAGFTSMEIPSH